MAHQTCIVAAAFGWPIVIANSAIAHPVLTPIYTNARLDARFPMDELTVASDGSLYGTAYFGGSQGQGVVFKLMPPAQGQSAWTAATLHDFSGTPDGAQPWGGVLIGPGGDLFGTTRVGGSGSGFDGFGTVFRLRPPSGSGTSWTEEILYRFHYDGKNGPTADGGTVDGGLVADGSGNLYGTTEEGGLGCGTVFQLSRPTRGSPKWTESVLYRFAGATDAWTPESGLVINKNGALYGTTVLGGDIGDGAVFQLSPPQSGQTAWAETVIYSFAGHLDGSDPQAALTWGRSGQLYGTTYVGGSMYGQGYGTVFQLTPPALGQAAWTENVIWRFPGHASGGANPNGGVTFGPDHTLWGTTPNGVGGNGGVVFRLIPPNPKHSGWAALTVRAFRGHQKSGYIPDAGLAVDRAGTFYGTTSFGGIGGAGTVFQIAP